MVGRIGNAQRCWTRITTNTGINASANLSKGMISTDAVISAFNPWVFDILEVKENHTAFTYLPLIAETQRHRGQNLMTHCGAFTGREPLTRGATTPSHDKITE
jgi:hypothetical protein